MQVCIATVLVICVLSTIAYNNKYSSNTLCRAQFLSLSRNSAESPSGRKEFEIIAENDKKRVEIDRRDLLPFTILCKSGENSRPLGTYILDSSTACGDVLELGGKGVFRVQKVYFLYKFDCNRYRVFKKKLEVTMVKNARAEQEFSRSYPSIENNFLQ